MIPPLDSIPFLRLYKFAYSSHWHTPTSFPSPAASLKELSYPFCFILSIYPSYFTLSLPSRQGLIGTAVCLFYYGA